MIYSSPSDSFPPFFDFFPATRQQLLFIMCRKGIKRVVSNKKYVSCFSDFYRRRKCNIQIRRIHLDSVQSDMYKLIRWNGVELKVLLCSLSALISVELNFIAKKSFVKKILRFCEISS